MTGRATSCGAARHPHGEGAGERRVPERGVCVGCAVGLPVPRVVGRAVGDPRRVGVAVGDPVACAVRVGAGRAEARFDGVGVGGPGVSDGVGCAGADGLGVLVLTTAAGRL